MIPLQNIKLKELTKPTVSHFLGSRNSDGLTNDKETLNILAADLKKQNN